MTSLRPWRLALALPALTLALSAQDSEELDRPDLREVWERLRTGGAATNEYLQWKGRVAAQEVQKLKQAKPAIQGLTVATPTWVNLGPTGKPANDGHVESGRILSILTHPTNPKTLYVGTAGGGMYKCVNADPASSAWTWTALTDALPNASANGDIAINALAMDAQNPNVLYLGLGGVNADTQLFFISRDGGSTWTQGGGLPGAYYVGGIMPLDSTTLLVTTYDALWRSTDGGLHFTKLSLGSEVVTQVNSLQRFGVQDLVISYDAQVVGAGNIQGRIAYSGDGGLTWTKATLDAAATTLTNQSAANILLATGSDVSTMAYGVFSAQGILQKGVLKSSDKGRSWTYVAAPLASGSLFQYGGGTDGQFPWNQLLMVDPSDSNRLFAGANNALYRSLDGGVNWTQVSDWRGMDRVWIHSDLHAGAWSRTGTRTLFLGTDGGLSVLKDPYRLTTPTDQVDSTFVDNTHNQGLVTHLIYNLGSTTAPTPANSRDRVSLGMQDNGTWIRTDMGTGLASSTVYNNPIGGDGFSTLIHPLNGDLILGSTQGGNVQRSSDGGQTFSTGMGLAAGAPFYTGIFPHPGDSSGNTVFTVQNDGLYKSVDFGATWSLLTPTLSPSNPGKPDIYISAPFVAGAATDPNILAMLGNPNWDGTGTIGYTSLNGGSTWTLWGVPTGGMVSPVSVAFDAQNAQTIYVSGASMRDPLLHHLWKSVNGGQSFSTVDGSPTLSNGLPYGIPIHVVKTDPVTPNVVYAAMDLGLYRSTDGGASWARFGLGLPMVGVRDLYVAPDATFLRVATYGRGAWELKLKDPTPVLASISAPASDLTVDDGTTVSFSGTGSSANPTLTYLWDFGDWTSAAGTSASHRFTNPTTSPITYTTRFVVKDNLGMLGSAARVITVRPPADIVAPTVSVACNGTSGSIGFSANATDNKGVTRVDFWVDGQLRGTGTPGFAGITCSFDSTLLSNGTHTLVGKAYDAAGNMGLSAPIDFTVFNAPPVFLEVEPNNTIATANVVAATYGAIQGNPASTSDPDYFALTLAPGQKITIAMTGPTGPDWDLYLKSAAGANLASSTGGTTTENLSYTNTGSTAMTVYANVVAYSGTSATPYNLALTYVSPVADTTAPTVTATESGTSGTLTFSATASDNTGGSGMAKVEFYVDGTLKATDTTSPYSATLDSTTLADGAHTLVAKAYDVASNAASSSPVAFTVSNGGLNQNEAEGNDTTATANTVLTSGTTVTGFISTSTDTDYYRVTVPAGHTLTATLTPPASSDFDLKIYTTTTTTAIASSTNGTGQVDTASVTNTGTTSVVRYIQVKHYAGASTTQSYKLKLTF